MVTLYGIPNCDTIKKAKRWLDDAGIAYRFHDFRKDGLDEARARIFIEALGMDKVINKRGTTWRKLPEEVQNNLSDATAVSLMVEQPALIKRPVLLLDDGSLHIGFKEDQYASLFLGNAQERV